MSSSDAPDLSTYLIPVDPLRLGPSVITVTGPLKAWDIRPQLHKIIVPVLLTNGEYEAASGDAVAPIYKEVPKVKWVTFARSAHMAHWSEREKCMQVVGDFLQAP